MRGQNINAHDHRKEVNRMEKNLLTNKEALIAEFSDMDTKTFVRVLFDGDIDLFMMLSEQKCAECTAEHGGHCPVPDDAPYPCIETLAEWMDKTCKADKLVIDKVPV